MSFRFSSALSAVLALVALPACAQAAPDAAAQKAAIDATLNKAYPDLELLYKDLHTHPELGFQEVRTAGILAERMRKLGFTVTEHVGKTGLVALYKNGDGPVVLVRTEMDALPVEEKTGLPYASHAQQMLEGKPVFTMQACGHDSHMAWWIGTAQALLAMKDQWHGTLMFIAQPAEEKVSGARAMLDDGLFTRFPKPDYGFGAHVWPTLAGTVGLKQGAATSAADAITVTFHGQGAHGSMPDKGIDPIVMGAHFVNDVQTVISRQKDPQKFGIVTVGSFNSGFAPNIIPDTAVLKLSLRSYEPEVRKLLNEGVAITAKAVADMAHAPAPEVAHVEGVGPVVNEPALTARVAGVLTSALGADKVTMEGVDKPGATGSEDYSAFVEAGMGQSVFLMIGGTDPQVIARARAGGAPVPVNHSPFFAPLPEPTIRAGVESLALAVLSVAGK